MIEILSEPRPVRAREISIPRNIRQMGNVTGENLVYMEDYVYRFLHSSSRKKARCTFVFAGEIVKREEKQIVYIKGALELKNISYGGGMPVFSEDMWDAIYRDCRKYFPEWSIVGWAMQTLGTQQNNAQELQKICRRHFPGSHGNVFLYDAYGEWEQMYLDVEGELLRQDGFCVYYEKNTPMGSYLSAYHAKQEQELMRADRNEQERLLVRDEERYENEIRQDREAMARYRSYVNGQQERMHGQKMKVALSIAMVVFVLLSGVLIQNFATLSDMEDAVEAISNQEAVKKAQEDVVKETIRKKADELKEVTTQDNEKKEEDVSSQETATSPQQNEYLTQGYYIVEKGDKLRDISKKVYGTEDMVDKICEKNGITDENHIQAGDKLLLP